MTRIPLVFHPLFRVTMLCSPIAIGHSVLSKRGVQEFNLSAVCYSGLRKDSLVEGSEQSNQTVFLES